MNVQCDHVIEARRPDIVVVDKQEKNCTIIDIAIPESVKRIMRKLKSIKILKEKLQECGT